MSLWYRYKEWRWERKCIKYFGCKPEKIYISREAFDELQTRLNEPPDLEKVKKLKEFMSRKSPWDT